jgi:hypothetical protein
LASYSTKEFTLTHGVPYPNNVLNRLKRRDLRLLVICCGGMVGYPYHAMVVMGLFTHALVVGILVNGWRLQSEDARPAFVSNVMPSPAVKKLLTPIQITEATLYQTRNREAPEPRVP